MTEVEKTEKKERTHTPIARLLARVMESVSPVAKRERNTAQNFNFRGIDAVVNAVSPALKENGVIVVPKVLDKQYSTVEIGARRTPMLHCLLTVEYVFYGPGGDSISTIVASEAMDSGDKATAKAMSVAFRIALLQALALPTDEPDPDTYSYERAPAFTPLTAEQIVELEQNVDAQTRVEALRDMYDDYRSHLDEMTTRGVSVKDLFTARAQELSGMPKKEVTE